MFTVVSKYTSKGNYEENGLLVLIVDWQHFRQLRNGCTSSIKKAKSSYFLVLSQTLLVIRQHFGKLMH
jgi:hypothetical protein